VSKLHKKGSLDQIRTLKSRSSSRTTLKDKSLVR